ncbi:MAG: ATP synthase F1 subunit gamma [Candidatus Aminicenantes bacterium]|nr:ATP synthase F1 subunit gamma [Candidatus Aminicenantes bacterium]
MPALIDLRRRIKSVRNTQQITQAMKTVATAKFKKAQRIVLEARPYWHNHPELLAEIARWAPRESHPLLEIRKEKRILGLVISSDKGLCGAFNANLLEAARDFFKEKSKEAEIRLILIGKKANLFFKKFTYPIDRSYSDYLSEFSDEDFEDLARHIIRRYVFSQTDAVYVIYNEFKSILAPKVSIMRMLPIEIEDPVGGKEEKSKPGEEFSVFPDWEPETDRQLRSLLPEYIEKQIQHFFYESSAAEYAARMMAMDNATQNAEDLIESLTLVLNKIRQASITKELLEIMSAVEALAKR